METDQACVRQCDSTEQSCLMVCEAKRTNSSRWRWGLLAAARDNPECRETCTEQRQACARGCSRPVADTTADDDDAEPTPERRLEQLKTLLDKGLINKKEYEQKRAEILRDL